MSRRARSNVSVPQLLALSLALTAAACLGYEWPPRPAAPETGPSLILPGLYRLSGSVLEKPLEARLTITRERWSMHVDDNSCSGKLSALKRIESEVFAPVEDVRIPLRVNILPQDSAAVSRNPR